MTADHLRQDTTRQDKTNTHTAQDSATQHNTRQGKTTTQGKARQDNTTQYKTDKGAKTQYADLPARIAVFGPSAGYIRSSLKAWAFFR